MDLLDNLALGFSTALGFQNVLYCFVGVLLGTLIGVLPGLGPVATIAMLLPITFGLEPVSAVIMLAGIYYGAQYGGSTTAILINLPGESSSVVTTLDGHQMAKQGRAGAALVTAAVGSFFAGSVAIIVLALFAPPLARFALEFGPPEYFALMVLGLIASVALASGAIIKALAMVVLGLLLGLIGRDLNTALPRMTFDLMAMIDGLQFVAIAMGVFGLGEIIRNLDSEQLSRGTVAKVGRLMLTREEARAIVKPILRGTVLGSILGILPGGGALLASFGAYTVEKKVSATPERFGKGAIEGVAAPESANNAGAQSSFIPMLTLGIPPNPVMALLAGALILHGIQPGPNVISEQPTLFWGLIASMWIGNLMLLILNLPLVGMWVRLASTPYHLLFPVIVVFCCIGVLSVNNATFDVLVMIGAGVIGYILLKLDCEPAPLLLGFILGPMLEEYLRRTLLISRGDPSVFFTRPLSATLLAFAVLLLVLMVLPSIRSRTNEALKE